MSPHKVNLLPSLSALPSYGITENGFLPAEPPLLRLPHEYYRPWEDTIQNISQLLKEGELRREVDRLPVLDTSHLDSESEWRRAYSILAIMTQGYIWQGPEPSQYLPPAISVALLATAEHLEVNPIASYAALSLWNHRLLRDPSKDTGLPDDRVSIHTLTGTEDESWFCIISNVMEPKAAPVIEKMLLAIEAVDHDDIQTIVEAFEYCQQSLTEIGDLLARMSERLDPQTFYHDIRPFLTGTQNMENSGLPRGVFYDEGNGKGSWRKYRGPSNGQSSLLQCFDAFLGVNHDRCEGFHDEMRRYMPGPHARFLADFEAIANIRQYVERHQDNAVLLDAYNKTVAGLSEMRNKHMQLVARYIILPSRQGMRKEDTGRKNLATLSSQKSAGESSTRELIGTGGTPLIPFLRTARDETNEASVAR